VALLFSNSHRNRGPRVRKRRKMDNRRNNKFYEEEIDDDEFLRHPKTGTSGYLLPGSQGQPNVPVKPSGQANNSFNQQQAKNTQNQDLEKQRQLLIERRQEIEERTLASSERGLGLLYESEKVGVATADELSRQKEQLMRTEQRLDDINSTLRNSEKHIQGIRSVFGAVRNYFGGRSTAPPPPAITGPMKPDLQQGSARVPVVSSASTLQQQQQSQRYQETHPGLRNKPGFVQAPPASVDDALDRNLDDMAAGLSRLKGLAQGLNSELNEHNDLLDRVNDKSEGVGFKVEKQNKAMEKILKK